jgi:hypothetical protein
MFRFPKSLILAAAGAGLFSSFCGEGLACPPRGGGGFRPSYQPQYYQPRYQPQAYQPQYCPPKLQVHPQVAQPQFAQPQVAQPQGQFAQQPVQGQFPQQGVQQQQFTQQGQVAPTGQVAQGGQGGQVAQQPVQQAQFAQQPAAQGGAATSALNALGSSGVQGQAAPAQAAPQQVQTAPTQPQQAETAPVGNGAQADASRSAADMALEALLGNGTQNAAPVAQETIPAASVPTGDFSASISNGAQVQLSLRADGSFNWIATKSGKQSSFQGSFSLAGSDLTLVRSDNQKLTGTLTQTGSGFQLKFAGQTDAGLSFVRANAIASR